MPQRTSCPAIYAKLCSLRDAVDDFIEEGSVRLKFLVFAALLLIAPFALPGSSVMISAPAVAAESDVAAILKDTTDPSKLDRPTLRDRLETLRKAIKSGSLARSERRQV